MTLTLFALRFETGAVTNSLEAFCRMNPEVNNAFLLGFVSINCQTDGTRFASMRRCGYGTVCYYVSGLFSKNLKFFLKFFMTYFFENCSGLNQEMVDSSSCEGSTANRILKWDGKKISRKNIFLGKIYF